MAIPNTDDDTANVSGLPAEYRGGVLEGGPRKVVKKSWKHPLACNLKYKSTRILVHPTLPLPLLPKIAIIEQYPFHHSSFDGWRQAISSFNATMNLQSGIRPINSSIDRSVDILSGEQGVIGCLALCPSQTFLQNVS